MSRHRWGVFVALNFLFVFALAFLMLPGAQASSPETTSANALQTCAQLLVNSDMESNAGWVFGDTPARAEYVTDRYRSPYRSILLGILSGPNKKSYSSMQQLVTVPAGSLLRLRAHVFPISQPYDSRDAQELIIMNSAGQPLRRVWTAVSDARAWQTLEFDISEFIGMQIGIYFNVYNDGKGGVTAMYIDDVTLELCTGGTAAPPTATPTPPPPTATPTPVVVTATPTPTPVVVTATPTPIVVTNTPTPTPTSSFITATPTPVVVTNTPTPTPTSAFITATPTPVIVTATPTLASVATFTPPPAPAPVATATPPPGVICNELLINGGFEAGNGWRFGDTKLRGHYTSLAAHSGLRSALLGNDDYARPNIRSYSSIQQRVRLPRGYASATLEFWHWNRTDGDPGDYGELVVLDGRTKRTLDILWRSAQPSTQWEYKRFDLSRYLGRDIVIYFNVFNDGGAGRASMLVDDVSLKVCAPVPPTAPPPAPGQPSPTPVIIVPTAPGSGASPPPTATPASIAPVGSPTPFPTATAAYPAAWPTKAPTPPLGPQAGAKGPWGWLWYLLIFAVIVFIFIVGYLLIRQIWGQVAGEEEEADEELATPTEYDLITPVILAEGPPPPPPPPVDEAPVPETVETESAPAEEADAMAPVAAEVEEAARGEEKAQPEDEAPADEPAPVAVEEPSVEDADEPADELSHELGRETASDQPDSEGDATFSEAMPDDENGPESSEHAGDEADGSPAA